MKKIKVLHIGMGPNRGGLESFTLSVQKNIDKELVQFDYTNTFDKPLAYEDERISMGSNIYKLCPRKKNIFKSNKQLKDLINNGQYDYVHFHCMHYCWFDPIVITCKKTKAKMIVHSHLTGFNKDTVKKEIILDKIGRFVTRNLKFLKLACGKEAGKWLFGKDKFEIIPNGISFDTFRFSNEKRKKIRKELGLTEKDIVIGHVGNFSYQKNYPKLISIFCELYKINNNYKLILVGNDKKESAINIKEKLKEEGLDKNVIFTGIIDNSINIYSAFDAYVFPSHYEGLNISLVEAQCSGLLCFASNTLDKDTNVGGLYKTININENSEILAKNINKVIINNKVDRTSISISEDYSIDSSSKKLLNYYINHLD